MGDIDDNNGGFHLGQVTDDARPNSEMDGLSFVNKKDSGSQNVKIMEEEKEEEIEMRPYLTEDEAFDKYKLEEGKAIYDKFNETKAQVTQKKKDSKSISKVTNSIKATIDKLTGQLDLKRSLYPPSASERQDGMEVIDEEEYQLIKEIKIEKKKWKENYNKRQEVTDELSYLKGLVEQSKMQLAMEFLEHYKKYYGDVDPGAKNDGDESVLDDGEAFQKLQIERVMQKDPDSVTFINAKKAVDAQKKPGVVSMRRGQRPKTHKSGI